MSATINRKFDPQADLPAWAQKRPNIVTMAAQDLAFRCDVWNAKTQQERNRLQDEAQRVLSYRGQIGDADYR